MDLESCIIRPFLSLGCDCVRDASNLVTVVSSSFVAVVTVEPGPLGICELFHARENETMLSYTTNH